MNEIFFSYIPDATDPKDVWYKALDHQVTEASLLGLLSVVVSLKK